jgi:hypothetical protein
VTLTLLA